MLRRGQLPFPAASLEADNDPSAADTAGGVGQRIRSGREVSGQIIDILRFASLLKVVFSTRSASQRFIDD